MSSKENKILITGSRGVVGSVIANHLKDNNYKVVELDINSDNPIDILNDNLNPYFIGISTFIHLAANPNPFIINSGQNATFYGNNSLSGSPSDLISSYQWSFGDSAINGTTSISNCEFCNSCTKV